MRGFADVILTSFPHCESRAKHLLIQHGTNNQICGQLVIKLACANSRTNNHSLLLLDLCCVGIHRQLFVNPFRKIDSEAGDWSNRIISTQTTREDFQLLPQRPRKSEATGGFTRTAQGRRGNRQATTHAAAATKPRNVR